MKNTKFVVIGGGTGTYSVLNGLKQYTDYITAIVTMADSGGSAAKERDEWGLLPSSDIRKSLIALADVSTEDILLLRKLFEYRYQEGHELSGMTFGNLFLVALTKILGSQAKAIEKAGEILRIRGRVLPVTMDNINLVAEYEDGSIVKGEHDIDAPKHNGQIHITKLYTEPEAKITKEAQEAIEDGDVIIIGPGGFYTTLLANFVIKGVREAVMKSKAKKIFILNLMTEYGQTYQFTASKFLSELGTYLPTSVLDYVLINSTPIPDSILERYKKSHAEPVLHDIPENSSFKVVSTDLLLKKTIAKQKGDTLQRSLIRHSSDKIARACLKVLNLL